MRNSKYIKMEAVEKLKNTRSSKTIREEFHMKELAFTQSGFRQLLSKGSHKFDMKNGTKIITKGMYLSASNEAGFGINTCKNATKECRKSCLVFSGRMPMNIETRITKTRFFIGYPLEFLDALIDEMFMEGRQAKWNHERIQFRLNGTSDINWEEYLNLDLLRKDIPNCGKFYDYTKNPNRSVNPDDYHLTYSVSDNSKTVIHALDYLQKGQSVAVVTSKTEKKQALETGLFVDGDKSDHRPQDPKGSIVLLSFKGKGATKHQRGTEKGFVKSLGYILKMATMKTGNLVQIVEEEKVK